MVATHSLSSQAGPGRKIEIMVRVKVGDLPQLFSCTAMSKKGLYSRIQLIDLAIVLALQVVILLAQQVVILAQQQLKGKLGGTSD